MKVPVQNVYFLLLYAWNRMREAEAVDVAEQGYTRLQDMFAHVLADAVRGILSRGLDRGYVPRNGEVTGIRGRMDTGATVKANLLPLGRTHCEFDEFTQDVLQNRILKATLDALLQTEMDRRNKDGLRALRHRLQGISSITLTRHDFARVQLHGNNAAYDYALGICRIVHENLMVEPGRGARFRDFQATQQRMGGVFEAFVYNFLDREQRSYRVSRQPIAWHGADGPNAEFLPRMKVDIALEGQGKRIIVDCKFYAEPLKHGTAESAHLYQILTYLHNAAASTTALAHEGILLYPVVAKPFVYHLRLNGFPITIRSLNLNQPWQAVHEELLSMFALSTIPTGQSDASLGQPR